MVQARRLLTKDDPDPVLLRQGRPDWLLTVEHAGRAVPAALGDLGLPVGEIDRHIGWDPGALELAQALADRLNATLVAQRYSRLVIDCNRPRQAPDLVPLTSDRTDIPRNRKGPKDHHMRWDEIHVPYHAAVAAAVERGARHVIAVHTYDPQRELDGAIRPWPIGLLSRVPNPLFATLQHHLSRDDKVAPLGVNQPYEIEDTSDYTIPVHAEPRNLPHVLIEVRNDRLCDAASVTEMADRISGACLTLERA